MKVSELLTAVNVLENVFANHGAPGAVITISITAKAYTVLAGSRELSQHARFENTEKYGMAIRVQNVLFVADEK